MPAKAKAAVDKYAGEPFSRRLGVDLDRTNRESIETYKKTKGQEPYELPPAEVAKWKKVLEPVTANWVKATPDGAHVLAAFRAEVKKIRAGM